MTFSQLLALLAPPTPPSYFLHFSLLQKCQYYKTFLAVIYLCGNNLEWGPYIQHNDTQHNDIQHNNKLNTTLSIIALSIILLLCCVSLILSINYAECRYAECRYAECRGAKECPLSYTSND